MNDTVVCDVLIAGAGAAGFSAALTAQEYGLDVVIVEKEATFGGTTAYSAGVAWIPANHLAHAAGLSDTTNDALDYLHSEVGHLLNVHKAQAYVAHADEALRFLMERTRLRYTVAANWPDYHPTLPGGSAGGRSLSPVEFDGRLLGDWFPLLRPPLRSMMAFGGMSIGRDDLKYVFTLTHSLRSAGVMTKLLLRYVRDRLQGYSRGTRLVNGNALVGRLALSAKERSIPLHLSAPLRHLTLEGGRVTGAVVTIAGRPTQVVARRGVVLACGGQAASSTYRHSTYQHVREGKNHHTVVPPANTGDGILAAQDVGAALDPAVHHSAAWTPVSLVPMADGSTDVFPHFIDRGKPGYIAVNRQGKRFVNESLSYHDFVPEMIKAAGSDPNVEAFIICDHTAIRRFGLGAAPPAPASLRTYFQSGYLTVAPTLRELAIKAGINPDTLIDAVERFNKDARAGIDREFGRGEDAYQRFNGSALSSFPNPCLAPLARGPFYALRIVPGDIGSFSGLSTDPKARVLGNLGTPIAGLYAVGNDMTNVMGGTYPGAGITLGPALTFGYLAAKDIAAEAGLTAPDRNITSERSAV